MASASSRRRQTKAFRLSASYWSREQSVLFGLFGGFASCQQSERVVQPCLRIYITPNFQLASVKPRNVLRRVFPGAAGLAGLSNDRG